MSDRIRATCEGKAAYESFRAAHKIIARMRKRHRRSMGSTRALRPYKCPFCDLFHVGHDKASLFSRK